MSAEVRYIKKNIDKTLVLGGLASLAFDQSGVLSPDDELVLQSLRRAVPETQTFDLSQIQDYLQSLDDDQLVGLANNVKGVLHEIQFVEIENEDGDEITAALFTDTNHPDTDVLLTNQETGETIAVQLKATDSESYVQHWIDTHDEGEILVTEEIAEQMGLESTEISNEELTADVSEFTEKLMKLNDDDSIWDLMPELPAISIAISGFYLFEQYRKGVISYNTFKIKFIRLTGIKAAKFTLIAGLLMVPGINILVGAGLLASLLWNTGSFLNRKLN